MTSSARGRWPGPTSNALFVNGDLVRATSFLRSGTGYDVSGVDDLLVRVAAELDAGRPAGQLIENATFQQVKKGYDVDAVDWFLDQLILDPGHAERAGTSADPWRDLPVAQVTHSMVSGVAGQPRYFAEECDEAAPWAAQVAQEHGLVCYDPQIGKLWH